MKYFLLLSLFSTQVFAQSLEIYTPSVFDGFTKDAIRNGWDIEKTSLENYSNNAEFNKLELNPKTDSNIDIMYNNNQFRFAYYTDINSDTYYAFYVQKVKKNTKVEFNGQITKDENEYLVEMFRSFYITPNENNEDVTQHNFSLYRSDLHWHDIQRPTSPGQTVTYTKEFTIGPATIDGRAENNNINAFKVEEENGETWYNSYWVADYQAHNPFYDGVHYLLNNQGNEHFVSYTVTVKITADYYSIRCPELGIDVFDYFQDNGENINNRYRSTETYDTTSEDSGSGVTSL